MGFQRITSLNAIQKFIFTKSKTNLMSPQLPHRPSGVKSPRLNYRGTRIFPLCGKSDKINNTLSISAEADLWFDSPRTKRRRLADYQPPLPISSGPLPPAPGSANQPCPVSDEQLKIENPYLKPRFQNSNGIEIKNGTTFVHSSENRERRAVLSTDWVHKT